MFRVKMQDLDDDQFEALIDKITGSEKTALSTKSSTVRLEALPKPITMAASVGARKSDGAVAKSSTVQIEVKRINGALAKANAVSIEPKRNVAAMAKASPVRIEAPLRTSRSTQDERLDELLVELSEVTLPTASSPSSTRKTAKIQIPSPEDLDKLLDGVATSPARPRGSKCNLLQLAGTRYKRGCNASMTDQVVCDRIYCTTCDHRVIQIQDSVWTGLVDYLFLRNNYPNLTKLSPLLRKEVGAVAYCCQCSWLSVSGIETCTRIKWRCAAH